MWKGQCIQCVGKERDFLIEGVKLLRDTIKADIAKHAEDKDSWSRDQLINKVLSRFVASFDALILNTNEVAKWKHSSENPS